VNIKSSANVLPTLSVIPPQTLSEDVPATIPFTVRDAETPASSLTVLAVSSNPQLLPNANVVLAGTGTNRTITLMPATNQFGTASVTLTVIDSAFGLSNMTFTV